VPDPHTIARGVHKLPPGHALTAGDGKVGVERYWELPSRPEDGDETTWRREIVRRLDDAVALRLVSDVPLGCFLSGGIDSTAVAASAVRQKPGLRTFSVGYAERSHDERRFARLAAERLGTVHEELLVSAADVAPVLERLGVLLDEPISDMSFVPLYLLSRFARREVTVALTGDGGDELFGGYPAMAADWCIAPAGACRRSRAAGWCGWATCRSPRSRCGCSSARSPTRPTRATRRCSAACRRSGWPRCCRRPPARPSWASIRTPTSTRRSPAARATIPPPG